MKASTLSQGHFLRSNILLLLTLLLLATLSYGQRVEDNPTLELSKPVERELAGGQSHSYRVLLTAGQYVYVIVDQRGVDVVVTLFSPQGKQIIEVDSPNGTQGLEPVFAIADTAGSYRLDVRSLDKDAPIGRYQVKIKVLRTATNRDKTQIAAERAFMQAELLRTQGTSESLREALTKYQEALPTYRAIADRSGEATTLNNIGYIYHSFGEVQKALDYFNQALQVARAAGDRGGEATTLNNIGFAYSSVGEDRKAFDYFMLALPHVRSTGTRGAEARTLNNIGLILDSLGEKQRALEYLERALPLVRELRDRTSEASTLINIGLVHSSLNSQQKALDYFTQALSLVRTTADRFGEAVVLSNIAAVYSNLGRRLEAIEHYEKALRIYHAIGDQSGEGETLTSIGLINDGLGDRQKALSYYGQALLVYRVLGDRRGEAKVLNNIGGAYNALGKKQEALGYYGQALSLLRAAEDRSSEALILNNINRIHNALSEKEKALDYAQAIPLKRSVGDVEGEAQNLNNLMSVYRLGSPRFAIFYGKESVNLYQQQRSNLLGSDTDTQKDYLKSVEKTYRSLAELLISEGRTAEAQQVLNAFKDQQFFDFDQTKSKQPEPLTLSLREEEYSRQFDKVLSTMSAINRGITELKVKLGNHSDEVAAQLAKLQAELEKASNQLSMLLSQAEAEFSKPLDNNDKVVDVPDVRELQGALREINKQTGQKTVAVYTLLGQDQFHAAIISADETSSVSSVANRVELNKKAFQLWAVLQSADYDATMLSHELYKLIFEPIEAKLPRDADTIIWSLDENLRYLPMAALYDGKQYLVERYKHVLFTRADRERITRAVSSSWKGYFFATSTPHTVTLFGKRIEFTSLHFIKDEMQIFRTRTRPDGVIDGDVLSETQFTQASLLAKLKVRRPLVHISSHFRFRPGDATNSFLVFGDDQVMTLAEMKELTNLFQGVELLVLSACDTAAQRPDSNGREVDAFAELAQRLGAAGVLASLWAVRDRSTAQLMKRFYTNREGGKRTKAEALQHAQMDFLYGGNDAGFSLNRGYGLPRRSVSTDDDVVVEKQYRIPFKLDKKRPFAHPYYWSPFVLFGNWK